MLKTVICDIDDTLYDYRSANDIALDVACTCGERELGVPARVWKERYLRVMKEQLLTHGDQVGCHSRAIRFQLVLEELRLPLRWAPVLEELYWQSLLRVISPMPGAAEFLREARSCGLRLGVCTDMSAQWQLRKLERLGLLEQMDFIVTSEEAGAEKPDSRIFQLCLDKANCLPEEALMIGDNLKKDVLGALECGLGALWFCPGGSPGELPQNVTSIATFSGLIDHINISSKGEQKS